MTIKENVKQNIRWIIEHEEGGNSSAFARRIGMSRQVVSNWVNGHRCPDIEVIGTIVTEYEKTMDWFLMDVHDAPEK